MLCSQARLKCCTGTNTGVTAALAAASCKQIPNTAATYSTPLGSSRRQIRRLATHLPNMSDQEQLRCSATEQIRKLIGPHPQCGRQHQIDALNHVESTQ